MNRIKYVFWVLAASAVCSAPAQSLEFTNLTLSTSPNLFHGMTNRLDGVVYGGNSNFLAVGANQIYVCGSFQPGQTWIANSDWVTNQILPAHGLNLTSVALGGNVFVATGDSNDVFSAANNFTPSGLVWTQNYKVFNNSIVSPAIAFNANKFVAAGELSQIGVSGTNLPTTFWTLWNPANKDFAESFRGLTGYGANGFAVCGRYSDIRLSNDGTNWQAAVSGQNGLTEGLPDLYSISYNGTSTFVSVGATNTASSINGAILASTNSAGTNWQTVYVNNTAGTPINAVTYAGSEFIAVGGKGQVLISSNGVAWTVLTNAVSPNNVNLYGVAFATNGYMVGVGEIVGDNGTVILAGTPPPAPINPVNETNCASYPNAPAYTPLSVTLVTDANHPAGTVAVDWYDAQGNLAASGTTSFTPTNNPNMVGINTPSNIVFYARERDLRTGFTTTSPTAVTLQIVPRPTATLSALDTEVCNLGLSFTLTNTLTGVGPWTIYWNDGTIQTASQTGPGPAQITRIVYPTNSFANNVSNNLYYVTIVTNADMCMGNVAGDIVGQDSVLVDPLPTATLAPLDVTNCNDGASFVLTSTLTGVGPWTVQWNDGTVETTNVAAGQPATLVRTVHPTNMLANAPFANQYYITNIVSTTACDGGPAGITGTNIFVVYPLPTAALTPLDITNCNTGGSNTLTVALTGVGPWTVYWNDGTTQSTNATIGQPATLVRTVYPTNTLANASSTSTYFVTNVVSANMCDDAQAGITGTDIFVINPLPTVTLTITTNDFGVLSNGIPTGLLENVSQVSSSDYNVVVGFQRAQGGVPYRFINQTLSVTNHLAFTGIGPWNVTLSDGNTSVTTNFSANGDYVWQETISTNVDTNYTFAVVSYTDTNSGCAGAVTNNYHVIVYVAPTAGVHTTNTACGNGSDMVTVSAVLGGFGPWTNVVWSDGFTNDMVTTSPFTRTLTAPANNSFAPVTTNYTIVSLTDSYGVTTTSTNDLIGEATLIVDPFLTFAPMAIVDTNYSCPDAGTVLSVSVPPGFTADWFADPTLLTNLAVGKTNYVAIITNSPGTNVYYVTMRYDDGFSLTNCAPDIATNVYLVAAACTNAISSITLTGTNAVVSWNGNYVLQSTTNLNPPVIWINVSTGALGPNGALNPNFLTNPVATPPNDFFRLYAPTN